MKIGYYAFQSDHGLEEILGDLEGDKIFLINPLYLIAIYTFSHPEPSSVLLLERAPKGENFSLKEIADQTNIDYELAVCPQILGDCAQMFDTFSTAYPSNFNFIATILFEDVNSLTSFVFRIMKDYEKRDLSESLNQRNSYNPDFRPSFEGTKLFQTTKYFFDRAKRNQMHRSRSYDMPLEQIQAIEESRMQLERMDLNQDIQIIYTAP